MLTIPKHVFALPTRGFISAAFLILIIAGCQAVSSQDLFSRSSIDRSSGKGSVPGRADTVPAKPGAESFTAGNIVVCRIGTGAAPLSNAATEVFLDEYTPAGGLVTSVAMPTTLAGTNYPLTLSGLATSECMITRSTDMRYIVVPGYTALLGTTNVSAAAGPRVVGRVDANGNIDTSSTTTSYGTSNIRSAATRDGGGFWTVGSSAGVVYISLGGTVSGTIVSNSATSSRVVNIFYDQLYVSGATSSFRLSSVGTGVPTTTGNSFTNLPGFPASSGGPNQFFLADLTASVPGADTLYVADDTSGALGGLRKYSLVAGTWTYNGTFPATASPSIPAAAYYGLTGIASGTTVTLYATRGSSAGNQIVSVVDATGYNAIPVAQASLVKTAEPNTVFRGIALSPLLAPSAAGATLAGHIVTADGRGIAKVAVTLEGGNLGAPRTAVTGPFGHYAFEGLPAGLTYVLTVGSKRYTFASPTRVINLDDELLGEDFVAEPVP